MIIYASSVLTVYHHSWRLLSNKTALLGMAFLALSVLQVLLGALYNDSTGLIFEGLGQSDMTLYSQGLTQYLVVALGTATALALSDLSLKYFSLCAVGDFIQSRHFARNSKRIRQLGDRVTDDTYKYYETVLSQIGQFLQHILRLVYFSTLMLVIIDNTEQWSSLNILIGAPLALLVTSAFLFVYASERIKLKKVVFEQNWVKFRTAMNQERFDSKTVNLHYLRSVKKGQALYFFEGLIQFITGVIHYSPYFIPLAFFAPLVIKGQITLGVYMRLAGAMTFVLHSLQWFSSHLQVLSELRACAARIRSLLQVA